MYYTLYAFLIIIIIIIIIILFFFFFFFFFFLSLPLSLLFFLQLKQSVIMGEASSGLLYFSDLSRASSTFLLSPQKRKHWCLLRKLWLATIRDLLWNVYARVKARKEPGGDGPAAREIKVRSCYTGSSIKSSKMRKSRHLRKFQTMSNQLALRQLQLDDCTHLSPWGSL